MTLKAWTARLLRASSGLIWVAAVCGAPTRPAAAATLWYVSASGNDANPCTAPDAPCQTPNGAIGRAAEGDSLRLTADTFTRSSGDEVVRVDKHLTLSGGWNADFTTQVGFTTLNGAGTYRGLTVTETGTVALDRFILEQGYAPFVGEWGGGGAYNLGSLQITRSEIRDNHGGGIASRGPLTVGESSLIGNQDRGAILSWIGAVTVTNSTLSDNQGYACGGLCMQGPGPAQVSNSTLYHNVAVTGSGLSNFYNDSVFVRNSIIARNTDYDCQDQLTLAGYNLLGTQAGCSYLKTTPTDRIGLDPLLGELTGMPRYRPLLAGSPALNGGDPGGCRDALGQPLDRDLRGSPRVGRCDIGAVETGLAFSQTLAGATLPGGTVTVALTLSNAAGEAVLSPVVVADTLPPELTLVPGSLTATAGVATEGVNAIAWHGDVPAGAPIQVRYSAVLSPTLALGAFFDHTASATWQGLTLNATLPILVRARLFLPVNAARYCADYNDDFSRSTSGWPIRDDAIARFAYVNDEYVIEVKQRYLEGVLAPSCARTNYLVAVDLRRDAQTGLAYGVVFGIVGDFEAGYWLQIEPSGSRFRLLRLNFDGTLSLLQDWTYSYAINSLTESHVLVRRAGNEIWISHNSQQIAHLFDGTTTGPTYSGILAYPLPYQPSGSARFDNFQVYQLPEPGTIATAAIQPIQSGLEGVVPQVPDDPRLDRWSP